MALNFHQLHIFYTVAEKGSFSAAAAALHMTQPAVTMQMQALEEYFGTKLLNRAVKPIELTEAGHALMPSAVKLIEMIRETESRMTKFAEQLKGRLSLAASLTIGEYVLPRVLGPFALRYPDITIQMKVMNSAQIIDEVLSHQIAVGLVEAPIEHPLLRTEPVMSDELMLVVAAGHEWASDKSVTLADVVGQPFVLREHGSGTRQVMESVFRARGYDPADLKQVMELGSSGAVKSAVAAGLGVSFLSLSAVRSEVELGMIKIVQISDAAFPRQFYSVQLNNGILSLSSEAFLAFLREGDLKQWL